MTLYRRLVLAITALIACLMAGNLVISIANSRDYVYQQMQIHAQDAATSLGVALTHSTGGKDEAQLRTFINTVFDRGDFQSISYRSSAGDLHIESRVPMLEFGIPSWFMGLVALPQTRGSAEVMSGVQRLGEVDVISNPGEAYRDLWRVFTEQCWLFALAAVLSYCLAGIGVRLLLRPLRLLEQQALAISRREFQLQSDLPSTPELRRVVMAMNHMVDKVQSLFREQVELSESLYRQAHLDDLTGVSNRNDFTTRVNSLLKSEKGGCPAALLILHVSGLHRFNDQAGRYAGDECLVSLAVELTGSFSGLQQVIIGRLSGSEFAVFAPFMQRDEAEVHFNGLLTRLALCYWLEAGPGLQLHLGASHSAAVTLGNTLLQESDLALRQAQRSGRVGLCWYQPDAADSRTAGDWREVIRATLAAERFTFFLQPLYAADGDQILQYEILCRLYFEERCVTAGVLLPMAERFGLAASLDRHILQQVACSELLPENGQLTMNLSPRSLLDEDFTEWLAAFLQRNRGLARRLVLEFPERILAANEAGVRELQGKVKPFGVQLSLDHFGAGASSFRYLQSLPLACLKLDRRFIESLGDAEDNRFFIRSLLQIAHACDVRLFADEVESEEQWLALQALV